mmetsp:Transcript_3829/g.14193  ORF Transcript_3829/g.14193 Transcript_3829/m.14193 type:complete len:578 (-) Transcript_3829:237-1970(-)
MEVAALIAAASESRSGDGVATAALLRLVAALQGCAVDGASLPDVEVGDDEYDSVEAAEAGARPELPGQLEELLGTQGNLDALVALLLENRFGGIERGGREMEAGDDDAADAAGGDDAGGGHGAAPGGARDSVELALDRALELLKCLPLSTALVTALARCAATTTRPVVRQQTFSYAFDWVKLWLSAADANAATAAAESAALFCGPDWGGEAEAEAAAPAVDAAARLGGPCEFVSFKAIVVSGLSDVWSAIRKACATRLYGVVHHLPLRRVEALVAALVDMCVAPAFADKWRCKEGALLGYAMLVKRFRRVTKVEASALRRASDLGLSSKPSGAPRTRPRPLALAALAGGAGGSGGGGSGGGGGSNGNGNGSGRGTPGSHDNSPVGALAQLPDSPLIVKRSMSISQMDRYHHPTPAALRGDAHALAAAGVVPRPAPRISSLSSLPSVQDVHDDDEHDDHGSADGSETGEAPAPGFSVETVIHGSPPIPPSSQNGLRGRSVSTVAPDTQTFAAHAAIGSPGHGSRSVAGGIAAADGDGAAGRRRRLRRGGARRRRAQRRRRRAARRRDLQHAARAQPGA